MSDSKMPFIDDSHPFDVHKFNNALIDLYEWGIDDVIIQDSEFLAVQRHGRLYDVGNRPLELDSVQELLNSMHKATSSATLQQGEDHNFTYPVRKDRTKTYRFRVNATATMGKNSNPLGLDITMRSIAQIPPTMEQLGIPETLSRHLFPRTGIVIIGGATGSGKSTLMGAVNRHVLTQPDGKRILTYESPIEFDFRAIPDRTGRIAQSDVYTHLKNYAHASANALRRHPDVIILGEARDAETIHGAIANAETGHTVYTTVHVNSVAEMLSRMVGVFPSDERMRALSGLIGSSRVLLYQTLVPTIDGGRAAAREYLVLSEDIRKTLYATPEDQITRVMNELLECFGNPLFRDIQNLYDQGRITSDLYQKYRHEYEVDRDASESANVTADAQHSTRIEPMRVDA